MTARGRLEARVLSPAAAGAWTDRPRRVWGEARGFRLSFLFPSNSPPTSTFKAFS